jgi:hypothetical protein
MIGTGVMRETPNLSSSSYLVIRSMRTSSTSIPLDFLVSHNCVIAAVDDLAYGDVMLGFSG